MEVQQLKTTDFGWRILLDSSLRKPARALALRQDIDVRVLVSNALREFLIKEEKSNAN